MFKPKKQVKRRSSVIEALFARHAEIFAKIDLDEHGVPKSDETTPAMARPAVTITHAATAPVFASAVPTYPVVTTPAVANYHVATSAMTYAIVVAPTVAVPVAATGNTTNMNYPQMATWRNDKGVVFLEKESKLRTAKRQALRQQQRRMLVTKKRIEHHRSQRAQGFRVHGQGDETESSHPQPADSLDADPKPTQDMSFYENQTYKESHAYVQERLTNVLGAERMKQLALYGRDLVMGIGYIEAALMAGGLYEAANVMQDMTHQALLPIHTLLQKCNKEIPLEEFGAEKLKSLWPMEGLMAVFEYLRGEPHLPPQAIDMMQGIQVICTALNNPTPFQDPLAPKPIFSNNSSWKYTPHQIVPAAKPSPSEGISVIGAASATAGSGFSKLLAATAQSVKQEQSREPGSTGSGFAKLLAATAEKLNSSQEASSDTAPNVSPDTTPETSLSPAHAARTAVLHYIATENLYFESEVQDLIRNNTVVGTHRRQASECLKELIGLANGEEGFLGDMDAGNYRIQIETCVTKINTLPTNQRLNRDTQALKKLCGNALKLWSVHAK
ncbi:hypothetical protein GGP41_006806 [Bipolaris sorokiniana]|uniref:Uncharacterized protein n=1 Tax=Cochliobolus sativus TaxID=45130 RepID=A0A8H5ZQW8_COCSA|nr:hypothetical protein GGP41_006806 [Bipolaris sorokiniana]